MIQTINEKEAAVIKKIFKMYLDGYSFTEICSVLNSDKVNTKMNGKSNKSKVFNTIWMPKTIKLILSNPTYIGKVKIKNLLSC